MPYDADGERWAEPLASPEDSENEGPGSCAAEDRSADHEAHPEPRHPPRTKVSPEDIFSTKPENEQIL